MTDFPELKMLYPLKFEPVYQERIWGGSLMAKVLERDVPVRELPIGESWELADRDGAMSVVANGPWKGATLHQVFESCKKQLAGPKCNTDRFPLMVKIIDAGERLSLQVHPDEPTCRKLGDGAEPKTEMWYIIAARKDGTILAGLNSRATRIKLQDQINSPDVENLMQIYPSLPGDAYFIPAGTLHAIGGGNLILEIQQNSDTTYRISDWGRVDAQGRSRELHVEKGMQSIDFRNRTSTRIAGVAGNTAHNRKFSMVQLCRYFKTDDLRLTGIWHDDTAVSGSFHLISAVNVPVTIRLKGSEDPLYSVHAAPGETVLVPYSFGKYEIVPRSTEVATVIRTTL